MTQPYNVLFLCTGNSARSILAEAIVNRGGAGRFRACSAGSFPKGQVHPRSLELLTGLGYDISELRSKSWDEFAGPDAPQFDFIFTVCDDAADEVCPVWPGHPMTAHWGIPDPAAAKGNDTEQHLAFAQAYRLLKNRVDLLMTLPVESIERLSLTQCLTDIGQMEGATRGE